MYASGRFNRRVEILEMLVSRTKTGTQSSRWVVFGERWATVSYISGNRRYDSGEMFYTQKVRCFMRFDGRINERMRIRVDGIVYAVTNLVKDFSEDICNCDLVRVEEHSAT